MKSSLFQGSLAPIDASGRLPQKEGIVIYTQFIAGQAGVAVPGKPLIIPDDYYFLLMQNIFTHPGGGNVFIRVYPPGTPANMFGSWLVGNMSDIGLDFSFVGSGGNPYVPIASGSIIVPIFNNVVGVGSQTIYGVQFKDACDENRKTW